MAEKSVKNAGLKLRRRMHIEMAHHVRGSIVDKFEGLERFMDFMISAIVKEKETIKDSHEKAIEGIPKEQLESYAEMFAEDYLLVKNIFTEVSLYSFIIIVYSYLEGVTPTFVLRTAHWMRMKMINIDF